VVSSHHVTTHPRLDVIVQLVYLVDGVSHIEHTGDNHFARYFAALQKCSLQ
jgi:hypothetical protein